MKDVYYWVLHHVGVDADPTPEQTARYHVEQQGWPGIGYHYVVKKDGTLYQTQKLTTMSYHVAGRNRHCVGILVNGDFREGRRPTLAQVTAVGILLNWLDQAYPERRVMGHKDLALPGYETECPGELLRWLGLA